MPHEHGEIEKRFSEFQFFIRRYVHKLYRQFVQFSWVRYLMRSPNRYFHNKKLRFICIHWALMQHFTTQRLH